MPKKTILLINLILFIFISLSISSCDIFDRPMGTEPPGTQFYINTYEEFEEIASKLNKENLSLYRDDFTSEDCSYILCDISSYTDKIINTTFMLNTDTIYENEKITSEWLANPLAIYQMNGDNNLELIVIEYEPFHQKLYDEIDSLKLVVSENNYLPRIYPRYNLNSVNKDYKMPQFLRDMNNEKDVTYFGHVLSYKNDTKLSYQAPMFTIYFQYKVESYDEITTEANEFETYIAQAVIDNYKKY